MTLTNDQLEDRIRNIESKLNDIQTAINNLATKGQLVSSQMIRQNEVNTLKSDVSSVQTELKILQDVIVSDGVSQHANLIGLDADDHPHYHTDGRGDARYYTKALLDGGQLDNRYFAESEFLDVSTGAGDGGKPIKLNASGLTDPTMLFQAHNLQTPTGTTVTLNLDTYRMHEIDLGSATGDVTITLSSPRNGESYGIKVVQGATDRDLVWPGAVKWPAGTAPVITSGEDRIDYIQLMYDGTNYIGTFLQDIS